MRYSNGTEQFEVLQLTARNFGKIYDFIPDDVDFGMSTVDAKGTYFNDREPDDTCKIEASYGMGANEIFVKDTDYLLKTAVGNKLSHCTAEEFLNSFTAIEGDE